MLFHAAVRLLVYWLHANREITIARRTGGVDIWPRTAKPKSTPCCPQIDFAKNNYQIVLDTTEGKITLDMLPDVAPGHVKNMLALAKIGYYDGLTFHRVITGFMIQGGCPEGTGTGGPGYTIKAEFNRHQARAGRGLDGPHQRPQFGRLAVLHLPGDGAAPRQPVHRLRQDGRRREPGRGQEDRRRANRRQDRPVKPVTINKATVVEKPKA